VATTAGLPGPRDEAVLDAVATIPSGRVATYGMVADWVGTGPRQVGRTLSRFGGGVPWSLRVRADGTPPPALAADAWAHLVGEGVARTRSGTRVDLAPAAWHGGAAR